MKKLILPYFLALSAMGIANMASAQIDEGGPQTYRVGWLETGSFCFCHVDVCLEVCWCEETEPGSGDCRPGTEACNMDCNNLLFPSSPPFVPSWPVTVTVPAGKHIISKKLRFNFSCTDETTGFEFDLMQPDGDYVFTGVQVQDCNVLTIRLHHGNVTFSVGN